MPGKIETSIDIAEILRQHIAVDEMHHAENVKKLDCIAIEMRRFKRDYEDTLKRQKKLDEQWADVKKELVKKGVTGALLWFIGIISVALWFYVKEHMK